MMRRGSVAQLGVMGIVLCLGIPTWEAYAQSVPAPVLSQVSPDRVAVGDLFTLTGEAFAAGEAQVTVNFGSIPVTVTPDSDTQISLTVPQGATSGPVTVTTTAMVNGQPLVQTSNPEDILVIWSDYSPPSGGPLDVLSWSTAVLPGANDDLYVVNGYADFWTVGDSVYHIDNQGQVSGTGGAWFSRHNGTDDYSLFYSGISARNPADGQVYGLLAENFD